MKCCEDVIVTVRLQPGGGSLDMELPAFMPMEELEQRFLETLRVMDPLHYGRMNTAHFKMKDRALTGDLTLAGAGVWDGSILDACLSEEG